MKNVFIFLVCFLLALSCCFHGQIETKQLFYSAENEKAFDSILAQANKISGNIRDSLMFLISLSADKQDTTVLVAAVYYPCLLQTDKDGIGATVHNVYLYKGYLISIYDNDYGNVSHRLIRASPNESLKQTLYNETKTYSKINHYPGLFIKAYSIQKGLLIERQ